MTPRSRWLAASVALAGGAGLGWLLGRLKLVYYYKAFGVGIASSDLTAGDLVFESWFVLQNLLFFVLAWWIVLKTRRPWTAAVALVHALIPIAAHYAFLLPDSAVAGFLIRYRHTALKLLPFLLLVLVWLVHPGDRERLRRLTWPVPPAGAVLFALVCVSWAISSAKHFGSFDANLALRDPAAHLLAVRLHPGAIVGGETAMRLFLLTENEERLLLWDAGGADRGRPEEIRLLEVRRNAVAWIEGRRLVEVQPGGQLF